MSLRPGQIIIVSCLQRTTILIAFVLLAKVRLVILKIPNVFSYCNDDFIFGNVLSRAFSCYTHCLCSTICAPLDVTPLELSRKRHREDSSSSADHLEMLAAFKRVWVACKRSSKSPEHQEPSSVLSAPRSSGPSVPAAGAGLSTLSGSPPTSWSPAHNWSQSHHPLGLCRFRPHPVTRPPASGLQPLGCLPGPLHLPVPIWPALLPTPVQPARRLTVRVQIPNILGCHR